MADAKPARPGKNESKVDESKAPIIEYFGEGADKIKFEVDPKATRIRVYADGRILVDY